MEDEKEEERETNREIERKEEGRNQTKGTEEGDEEEQELTVNEINRALKKIKLKKAAGIDGIPMEAWIFGGGSVRKRIVTLLKIIWKEKKISEEWRKSIIVPLYKEGEVEKTGNYRRIFLLCTAYKIYAEILREKLEDIIEEKRIFPESSGF